MGELRRRLRKLKKRSGGICGVALDDAAKPALEFLTKDVGRVVTLTGFFDLAEIVVATVADVCAMPCDKKKEDKSLEDVCPKKEDGDGEGDDLGGELDGVENRVPDDGGENADGDEEEEAGQVP